MSGELRWMGREAAGELAGAVVGAASYAEHYPDEADELVKFAAADLDNEAAEFLRRVLDAKQAAHNQEGEETAVSD